MKNFKKVCFYCPEDVFQAGGGATVAKNILREFDNGTKNTVIFSKRTIIPNFIIDKYFIIRVWYPKNTITRTIYDMIVAPIILLKHYNKKVICLNSLVPLLYPFRIDVFFQMRMFHFEEFDTFQKKIKNFLGRMSIRKAKNIFVASEDHRNDIIKNLKDVSKKLIVAPLGFDFSYEKENLYSEELEKKEYWLFISIFRPYKNIDGLIEAYGKLYKNNENIPDLFLIGDYPNNYQGIENYKYYVKELIKKYHLSEKVFFLGVRKHDEAMKYLCHSSLFIFPSKFEGFGLPILEAMALGTPVLSSDAHSLSEVGGDTIMYFKYQKNNDLYLKMLDIYNNGYNKSVYQAMERSKIFTWSKTCSAIANSK